MLFDQMLFDQLSFNQMLSFLEFRPNVGWPNVVRPIALVP
jgi:hypothetical protein